MTSLFAMRMLLAAGELLVGSCIVMGAAWAFAPRRSAGGRHLVWASAFGAALLLPVLAAVLPSPLRIFIPESPAIVPAGMAGARALAAALPAGVTRGFAYDPATAALLLGALWLAGVLVVAARFAAGAFCLAALGRRSRPFACAPENLPKIAAVRRECELRLSESEYGPATWGLFHPVILLPRTAVFWTRQRLHAVLLHELAHIRRRDSLVQALSLVVCALYWPNPLVWLGARALRREAEMAADDSVLLAGLKPSSYANELLHLAAEFRARQPAFSALSLFMAAPSALESRVESVLEPGVLRTGVTRADIARTAAAALIAAGALALACPSLAQDAVPHVPPAPAAPQGPAIPPAPAVPDVPAMPPAPPVPSVHIHVHGLSHADAERLRRAIARLRPEIERSLADAHIGEQAALAVENARPDIEAAIAAARMDDATRGQVDRALAQARVELAQAHMDTKIRERVQAALECAEQRLKAAEAREKAAGAAETESAPSDDN